MSSTLKISGISAVNADDLTNGDNMDSLEDLNKEIEKFCPFNNTNFLHHPNDIKFANSRFCDIFSRQSMESDDNDNSSPDDEDRIDFFATIPQAGCEILQLVPKKPVVTTANNKMYQPCTNSNVQLKQSSFSAFNSLRELTTTTTDSGEDEACGGCDEESTDVAAAASSTSHISSACSSREIVDD